jgi:hypothetical protein
VARRVGLQNTDFFKSLVDGGHFCLGRLLSRRVSVAKHTRDYTATSPMLTAVEQAEIGSDEAEASTELSLFSHQVSEAVTRLKN